MRRQNSKLRYLENLSMWQESARRHAHEIRTPLTATRLELESLSALLEPNLTPPVQAVLIKRKTNILAELERLADFTRSFVAFAQIGVPRKELKALKDFVVDFGDLYSEAWPNLTISYIVNDACEVAFDGDMLRQVLVNLCSNSAKAALDVGRAGHLRLVLSEDDGYAILDVIDEGPGLPVMVLARLFQPYVSSKKMSEGMGLGLAISKKIMLDHGGDLELLRSDPAGTEFRIRLPRATKGD